MNKQPKPGDKIRITAEVLPDYGKEFIIVGKVDDCELYQYQTPEKYKNNSFHYCGYAGVSQFEIVN